MTRVSSVEVQSQTCPRPISSKAETMLHLHDIEAWRAGSTMVHHFGPHALRLALTRIDDFRAVGDVVGAKTWALIADVIIELTREREHDEPLN
jgi:hypothetical protein